MPTIPRGDQFGQVVARPTRYNETQLPAAAFGGGIASAMTDLGQQMERERDEADRAQAAYGTSLAQTKLAERAALLGTQILDGSVSKDDAVTEWRRQAAEVIADARRDAPVSYAQNVERGLNVAAARENGSILEFVRAKNRDDVRGSLLGMIEVAEREAMLDRNGANAKVALTLAQLGPIAGYSQEEMVRMQARFSERAALIEGSEKLRMARDDPGQIDEVMKTLRSSKFADLSPEGLNQLEQQAVARKQYLENQALAQEVRERAEATRMQTALYGTAQLQVETKGMVTPEIWQQLNDGHRASLINRLKAEARARRAEAEGRPIKTDWKLYLDLRQQAIDDPKAFTTKDIKEFVDRIGPAQLEQLIDLKGSIVEKVARGLDKAPREAVTLHQQMVATMQALKIRKPEAKGQFMSFVQERVDDATQAKGKPLTYTERQQILDEAVLEGPDPSAWLWGTKRNFELTPKQRERFKPDAPSDAPATEHQALNEALRAQRIPETPANRLMLYRRASGGNAQ